MATGKAGTFRRWRKWAAAACLALAALGGFAADLDDLLRHIEPLAMMEVMPLAMEALAIQERATAREARHVAELAKRGIAEVPPCAAQRYTIDAGGCGKFLFDGVGEFYIDRRFVTDDEMKTVHAIERWFGKWFGGALPKPRKGAVAGVSGAVANVPVFRGFEDARYQMHDALIARMVGDFNAHKAAWCGGTAAQAAKIRDLTPALVKSQMIEETGGNGPGSKAAWAVDPLQVNVPGDWGAEKELVGLKRPARRNEGTPEANVRAAIMYLSRKGFGASGRPAAERPKGFFDGWPTACRRYNGRRDRTDTDRYYSDEYADKIIRRAADPKSFVPVEIRIAAPSGGAAGTHGGTAWQRRRRELQPARQEAAPEGNILQPPHETGNPAARGLDQLNPQGIAERRDGVCLRFTSCLCGLRRFSAPPSLQVTNRRNENVLCLFN